MQGTLSSSVETGVGSAAMEASFVVVVGCMGRFCTGKGPSVSRNVLKVAKVWTISSQRVAISTSR